MNNEFEYPKCPKCGHDGFIVIRELERHKEPQGEGYEVLHCFECCSWFKAYWKFNGIVELVEKHD